MIPRNASGSYGRGLAAAGACMAWAGMALLSFLTARQDWVAIAIPWALAVVILSFPFGRAYWRCLAVCAAGFYVLLFCLEFTIRLRCFGPRAITHFSNYAPFEGVNGSPLLRPSDDPALSYGLMPGFSGWYMGHAVHVDSVGCRDDGAVRQASGNAILVVGTSIAFGSGVDETDSYSGVLQRELDAAGLQSTVFNCGVPGYAPTQELALAGALARDMMPKAVVLELAPHALTDAGDAGAFRGAPIHVSPRVSLVERYSFAATGLYPPSSLRTRIQGMLRSERASPPLPAADQLEDLMKDVAAAAVGGGFRVYVVLVRPMSNFEQGDLYAAARGRVRAIGDRLGVSVVDTYPLFQEGELADDFLVFPGDAHPNARAHARIGKALAAEVKRQLESAR